MSLLPRTLRYQFALALGAMLLLVLASGGVAVRELLLLSDQVQLATRERLSYFNDAQELLEHTRQVQLYATRARAQGAAKGVEPYDAVLHHLDELDRLIARLAVSDDAQVLDLHESSQLFRSAAQVVAQLRELPVADRDEGQAAQAMNRSLTDMQTYASQMVAAAQQQSAAFSQAYQASVDAMAQASRRTAWLVALLIGGSLGAAWLIAHWFLGHHVVGRLHVVSAWLRDRSSGGNEEQAVKVPVEGEDEVAQMARAVELSVRDRQQLAHARQLLEESRRRLEAIFENTADAILVLQHGRVQQLNGAAHRLFRLRPGDGVGTPVHELLRGDSLHAAEGLGGVARQATAVVSDGSLVPVEVTVSEVQVADGALTVAVLRDATLHREAERHLTEARNAAEAARAAQAALLASMNHEMRTPLNGVLGYAQLLALAPNLTECQRQQLGVIESSGQLLLALVNDALDLAKHEAGKAELQLGRVDLAEVARAVADLVRLKAEQAQLAFVCEMDERLPDGVLADGRRLRQVLLNLAGNAVKFTEHGRVSLKISLLDMADGRARVRFEVADSGIGMTTEQVLRIFRPFEQFGPERTRAVGTGLGMAISQQLVRLMGGEIEVQSAPGHGSIFSFELQLVALAAADPPATSPGAAHTSLRSSR